MILQEDTLELLKRSLDAEEQSEKILRIPADTYSRLALHIQKLRRVTSVNGEDLTSRLIKKEISLIQGMVSRLIQTRLDKAKHTLISSDLLPEEKYLSNIFLDFTSRFDRFVTAILNGQPSFFEFAHDSFMSKRVIVRFLKPMSEIVGLDLKKYGPFKAQDIAIIPAGNAEVLSNNGEALLVHPWEEDSI